MTTNINKVRDYVVPGQVIIYVYANQVKGKTSLEAGKLSLKVNQFFQKYVGILSLYRKICLVRLVVVTVMSSTCYYSQSLVVIKS
jgi:hypothetical protein